MMLSRLTEELRNDVALKQSKIDCLNFQLDELRQNNLSHILEKLDSEGDSMEISLPESILKNLEQEIHRLHSNKEILEIEVDIDQGFKDNKSVCLEVSLL